MKHFTKIFIGLAMLFTTACSFETVPPAHKGKLLTPAGYTEDVIESGKITTWPRQTLILLETGTGTFKESMSVIMRDKLTLKFDVRFRARIAGTDAVINSMFNDITPDDQRITLARVYHTYGKMVVRNKAREVLSSYSVEDVHTNYKKISSELYNAIQPAIEGTPITMSDIALANIKYPDVITNAVEIAKERELAIEKEEAQAKINLTKKKNERRLAEADYQIRITKAKAIRDENKLISQGVTPELIEFRRLEVLEKMSDNQNAVFMPVEAMTSVGAQTRIYSK